MDEAYLDFASYYDQLMDNIPYDEWCAYLLDLFAEYKIMDGLICELGCGTGIMTEKLAAAGYDMIGIDNSINMLDIANAKKAQNNSSSLYLCQDMREFELFGTIRAVISICDSINYILEPDELCEVFRLVNNYLDPKGLFIFDFHPRHYYRDIVADQTIAEAREEVSFIWENYYDDEENINELSLNLFVPEAGTDLYRRCEELHLQRGYTLEEITGLVQASGLEFITAYDAFTRQPPNENSERIYVIAREQGK